MKDYTDIGINKQFRRDGSLAARRRDNTTAYDFGVKNQMPTGGISYSQLNVDSRAFTNNKLTGDVTSNSMIEMTSAWKSSFSNNYIDSDNSSDTLFKVTGSYTFHNSNLFRHATSGDTIEVNGDHHFFSNNYVLNDGTGKCLVIGSDSAGTDICFTGGMIKADGDTGIKISNSGSEKCVISGNVIEASVYGVDVDAGVDKTIITSNSMYGASGIINDNGDKTLYQTATDGDPLNTT